MLFRNITLGFVIAVMGSCANRVAPEGGPKDGMPPKLISSQPENYSHSFSGNEILLQFDEYIQLNDADKQIILSPLPDEKPEFSVKKKSLSIKFKNPLKANTTYTLSFGNAIADIHEANALNNFRFVFSTGSYVDSLSVFGSMEDAFTLQPAGDVTVMLYTAFDDSLPFHARPAYIARTDASGKFLLENLSASSFKLFALKDKNSNYLYDHPDEWIAWTDEPVVAGDSVSQSLLLIREVPQKLKLLNAAASEPVKAMLVFNKPSSVELKEKSGNPSWHSYSFNKTGDSVIVWMADTLKDSLNVYLMENNQLFDSVFMSLKKPSSVKQKSTAIQPLTVMVYPVMPGDELRMQVSHPVKETHDHLFRIFVDSSEAPVKSLKPESPTTLVADFSFIPDKKYEAILLPGALTDIYGRTHDTLKIPIKVLSEKETGSLSIQLINENEHPLIISLVNDKEQSVRDTLVSGSRPVISFSYLPAGGYKLKAVEDRNQNGKWDTGHYLKKQKPERVSYFKEPVTIRANWDVEHIWKPEFK